MPELSVQIGADIKGLQKGIAAAEKELKKIEPAAKKSFEALGKNIQ